MANEHGNQQAAGQAEQPRTRAGAHRSVFRPPRRSRNAAGIGPVVPAAEAGSPVGPGDAGPRAPARRADGSAAHVTATVPPGTAPGRTRALASLAGFALLLLLLAGCGSAGGDAADGVDATGNAQASGSASSPAADPSATATTAASQDTATGTPARWRPRAGLSWQWQLTTPVDVSVAADVYDIDAAENPASVVAALHHAGRRAVCYVNAGSWEPYRPDAQNYPKVLLGKALDGWPDERWLDIRRIDLLTPLLAHRLDECRAKGFDGVEPDNVDGYQNDTGFPLSAADQLAFDRAVARLAHQRGLAVGLKNDFDQVAALQPDFDYAVDEQCAELRTCAVLSAFVTAGKPVFDAEYSMPTSAFCAQTRSLGISAIRKHLELDAWRQTC